MLCPCDVAICDEIPGHYKDRVRTRTYFGVSLNLTGLAHIGRHGAIVFPRFFVLVMLSLSAGGRY